VEKEEWLSEPSVDLFHGHQDISSPDSKILFAPVQDWGARPSFLRASVTTLRRVPVGVRIQVARTLSAVLDDVVDPTASEARAKLFFFPYAALPVSSRSYKVKGRAGAECDCPFPEAHHLVVEAFRHQQYDEVKVAHCLLSRQIRGFILPVEEIHLVLVF